MTLRTAGYWLITAALFALVNLFVASSHTYRSKTERVDGHIERLDAIAARLARDATGLQEAGGVILFIGNSYVRASVVPPEGRDDLYVLTVNGMPLNDMAYVLRALPKELPIQRIVLGLGYNYATPVRSQSYVYRKYTGNNAVARLWWSLPVARAYSLSSFIVQRQIKCWRMASDKPCDGATGAGEDSGENMLSDPAELERSVARRFSEYMPYTTTVSEAFGQELGRLKALAAEQGRELAAYTAPIAPQLRARLPAQTLQTFRATVERSGIPYLDMNLRFGDWNYTEFSDATHVRRATGGLRTTNALLEFIAERHAGSSTAPTVRAATP